MIGILPLWNGTSARAASFSTPTNIDANASARETSIAIDQSSGTHVAYYDDGSDANASWVLYSSKTLTGGWTTPKLIGYGAKAGNTLCTNAGGSTKCDPSGVSLAIGADATAYIAFFSTQSPSSNNAALWYAKVRTTDGVLLSSTVVDNWMGSSLYTYSSIAVDGAGNPHIAYSTGGVLGYARFDTLANSWIKQTPDSGSQVNLGGYDTTSSPTGDITNVQQLSLALDATGYGRIAYYDGGTQQVKYVSFNGTAWDSPEVAGTRAGTAVLPPSSTAVSSRTTSSIQYTWSPPTGPTGLTTVVRYGPGDFNSDGTCKISALALGSFSSGVSPFTIPLPAGTTEAFQVCVANILSITSCDKIIVSSTTRSGTDTTLPPLQSCGGATGAGGTYDTLVGVSMALDGSGVPQISYMDYNTSIIYYAKRNGAPWAAPTQAYPGAPLTPLLQTSLALDGAGNPSVAFGDFGGAGFNGDAWLTWLSGTWQAPVEAVRSPVASAYSLSLSLDATGNPQMAYSDSWNHVPVASATYAAGTGFNFAAPLGGSPRGKVMAPDKLTASSASNTSITWTWRSNSGGNESNFQLFEPLDGITSTGPFHAVATIAKGTTFYTQTGLTAQTTYFAYVAAVNAGGLVTSSGTAVLAYAPCTPAVGISVDISTYDFTAVTMGATTISTKAITVTNTGTCGITETYSLSAATATSPSSVWSLAVSSTQAAGPDRALLEGAFSANSPPASASFDNFADAISTTAAAAASGAYTLDGTTTGTLVPSGAARYLWFKLVMPTTTSYVSPPQQTITVTITAGSP